MIENNKNLLSVSVLIPTLNAARVLETCLKSIYEQDYPKSKVEIIIADGGSTDKTLEIAKEFETQVCQNPLKTAEAGKATALRQAKGELVALVDSDNFLPDKFWLKKMVEPFSDKEILGAEPWEFTHRRNDSLINRYCALLGMNDPYCFFIGNYDKRCFISGKWTGLALPQEDKGNFIKIKMSGQALPTVGANGTIWRAKVLKETVGRENYLFDTDIPYFLASKQPFYFAKVKVSITHDFCHRFRDFYRKQKRRAKDFFYLEKKKTRKGTYQRQMGKQLYFILASVFLLPLFYQAIKGYLRKPDKAWLFHPIACLVTLWVYGTETLLSKVKIGEMSRKGWGQ